MDHLIKKLPSEATAKKLVIIAIALFILCQLIDVILLSQIYGLAGPQPPANASDKLEAYSFIAHALLWLSYITIGLAIGGGIILAIHHQTRHSQSD